MLASPAVARAKCVPLRDLVEEPLSEQPKTLGEVSVIIVPRSTEADLCRAWNCAEPRSGLSGSTEHTDLTCLGSGGSLHPRRCDIGTVARLARGRERGLNEPSNRDSPFSCIH